MPKTKEQALRRLIVAVKDYLEIAEDAHNRELQAYEKIKINLVFNAMKSELATAQKAQITEGYK